MSRPWDEEEEELPSKSELKRRSHALQKLGEKLIELPAGELDALRLDEKLRDAIVAARGMNKRGALTRQRQYIGRLMRDVDPEPIQAALDRRGESHRRRARHEHEIEHWRERLMADEPAAWTELSKQLQPADLRELRSLVRQARAERSAARPPASARILFRKLREIL
jgi:ribosome-associated protein